jgi:nucleoside-diphosphate-sugar epimerase
VYGIPEKHPISEEDRLSGVGAYGESKITAEKLCQRYRSEDMCVPIIRPKTFIGSGRLGVFQILYDWVERGKKIPMIGEGGNYYQLLDVEDLVDAIYLMLTGPNGKANDVFNVGAEMFRTVREDLGSLCEFAGTGARPVRLPAMPAKFLLRLFDRLRISPLYKWVYETADKDSSVSIDKIRNNMGWSPRHSNANSLIRSYTWYLEHKKSFDGKRGVSHRAAWNQGILELLKKIF